jgi:hypothetical protein
MRPVVAEVRGHRRGCARKLAALKPIDAPILHARANEGDFHHEQVMTGTRLLTSVMMQAQRSYNQEAFETVSPFAGEAEDPPI